MKKRELGSSKLQVTPLCFGGNVFGWTADEATSFSLLDAFVAGGGNFIDTADVYSSWVPGNRGGESETIIGKWLRKSGKRENLVLATKVGMKMGDGKEGLSRQRIFLAVDESLRRLQTNYIDLYQAHHDDASSPLEETLSAFAELIESGKVRAIGASNYTGKRLMAALNISRQEKIPAFTSLQPLYNLYDRMEFESTLAPVCREFKVGVIPYYSLASGFLTGKYRSQDDLGRSQRGARANRYLNERGLRILAALDQVAEDTESSQATVALAWLMAQPTVTAPIASATSLSQLDQLLAATHLDLDARALSRLSEASSVN
jgi:aryl-alcohol dehydrogenase-like predicted oxidoreductase